MESINTPNDLKGKTIAIIYCWFLGLGSLISWNSILTIADYYYNVFPDYHPSRVFPLIYQPFSLVIMVIFAHNESKINTRKRNIFGYSLFCLSTFALLLVDLGTSGKGGIANYLGICILVAAFGVADGHVQGGVIGDLSYMCPEFIQSFFAGLAASGALTSGLRLVTKAAFDRTDHGLRKGVMLFLTISICIEFLCIIVYSFVFGKLPIVKYLRQKAASEGCNTVSADLAAVGIRTPTGEDYSRQDRLSNRQLLLQNIDYAIGLFLTNAVTLSIFPGFLYENTGTHKLGSWYAIVLVAMYNIWNLISRYIPLVQFMKLESRIGLMTAMLSRFAFIPAFYFTAKYGEQGWMIFLVSFLGLTNGYLTVCIITTAPKGFRAPEQNALGNLLVLFLLGGILSGVALDWLWIIR